MIDIFLWHLNESIPDNLLFDMGSVILLTLCLVLVDIVLRLLIEAVNYNTATGKAGTLGSILFTIAWRGWGEVKRNGKKKRYMMSKGLRNGLAKKLLLQYPGFFVFSLVVYIYPDYEIFGMRIDETVSVFLLSLPILCEVMSIVENLNEIDPASINALNRIVTLIKGWRA